MATPLLFCDNKQWVAAGALILHPTSHRLNHNCLSLVKTLVKTPVGNEMMYASASRLDFGYRAGILKRDDFECHFVHFDIYKQGFGLTH